MVPGAATAVEEGARRGRDRTGGGGGACAPAARSSGLHGARQGTVYVRPPDT